jgi:transcriptional regulator with XRE-family HTH domain
MSDINIKELRRQLGLTQEQFAQKLGVTLGTVQNYEAGRVIPASKKSILQNLKNGVGNISGGSHLFQTGEKIVNKSDDSGKYEEQGRRLDLYDKALFEEIRRYHEVHIKKDEHIERIIEASLLKVSENMQRFDNLVEQNNKLIDIVSDLRLKNDELHNKILELLRER